MRVAYAAGAALAVVVQGDLVGSQVMAYGLLTVLSVGHKKLS